MSADHVTAKLGDRTYVLVPQKHTRLKRELGTLFDSLGESDVTSGGGLLEVAGDKGYEVCRVFIPDLMSREEWETDEHAPTLPQIMEAVKTGARVNGLSSFRALGNVISPELIRALLAQNITELIATSARRSSSSSPSPNGESGSTPSTTTPPTSPAPAISGSPSPDSPPSTESASSAAAESSETSPTE